MPPPEEYFPLSPRGEQVKSEDGRECQAISGDIKRYQGMSGDIRDYQGISGRFPPISALIQGRRVVNEDIMRLAKNTIEQEERSLLWSFCQAADILYEQFDRLEQAGTLSYSLLRSLIGESSQKGLLWYLKDKAHALFEGNAQSDSPGALLDWSLGYIFHESVKLMEDTRLQQAYVVRFDKFTQNCPQCVHLFEQFDEIEKQTRRSIAYEANRLDMLLRATMDLFGQYFSGRVDHRPLARLLFDQESLFRRVFGDRYTTFLQSVYADNLYYLYVEAGNSLLEAGKMERAQTALAEATRLSRCDTVRCFEQKFKEMAPEGGGA